MVVRCTDGLAAQLAIVEPETWRMSSRGAPSAGAGRSPTEFERGLNKSGADLAAIRHPKFPQASASVPDNPMSKGQERLEHRLITSTHSMACTLTASVTRGGQARESSNMSSGVTGSTPPPPRPCAFGSGPGSRPSLGSDGPGGGVGAGFGVGRYRYLDREAHGLGPGP